MKPAPIFLLTGPPGAGKSTVSQALLRCFAFGFHIPIDDLRGWVVSGISHPIPIWTPETTRQFRLARRAASQLAQVYADAGFAVVLDDIVHATDVNDSFDGPLSAYAFYKILLLPEVDIALGRNRYRRNKDFETSVLNEPIRGIHRSLASQTLDPEQWLVIDSSRLSIDETVDEIIARTIQRTT